MCGIVAIFGYRPGGPSVDRPELLAIRDSMRLRGPDGAGEWFSSDGRVGLGHRRLAIIDLSPSGVQPMTSNDGSLHIVFNGEIYNYRALRAELENEGCRFRSTSDTEVILELYRRSGEEAVKALRGMFTFAIWDARRGGLFLARDPFGIKPLYYADDGSTLRIASQVKALRTSAHVGADPDPAGVTGFFLWGSVPEPHTLYRQIRQLPAGHMLWADASGAGEPRPHIRLSEIFLGARNGREGNGHVPEPESPARIREEARQAFLDSVRHHLVADVPVGAFLSAGIDSTAIVSLAREVDAAPLRTVTLSFEEYRNTPRDEAPLAEATAARLGTRHETRVISRARFLEEIPRLMEVMDQPSLDGVNSYFVSQAAAEAGLKVALSGLGGDELLGGYPSFRDLRWLVRAAAIPSRIPGLGRMVRPVLRPMLGSGIPARYAGLFELADGYAGAYLLRKGLFAPWELPALLGDDLAREGLRRLDPTGAPGRALVPDPGTPFARVSVLEASLFMRNQLLRDADWASMAHSLELRVPFVDVTLWRALARLLGPSGRHHGKQLLADALRPPLPPEQIQRKKTGFGIPVWEWLASSRRLDVWKRVPMLHHRGFQGARRWAYTVFDVYAEGLLSR